MTTQTEVGYCRICLADLEGGTCPNHCSPDNIETLRGVLATTRGALICICNQRPHSHTCIVSRVNAALGQ